MPLYICSKCDAIENTTQGNYISYLMKKVEQPSCSECVAGTWHNIFPKQIASLEIIKERGKENFDYLGKFERILEDKKD